MTLLFNQHIKSLTINDITITPMIGDHNKKHMNDGFFVMNQRRNITKKNILIRCPTGICLTNTSILWFRSRFANCCSGGRMDTSSANKSRIRHERLGRFLNRAESSFFQGVSLNSTTFGKNSCPALFITSYVSVSSANPEPSP